MRGLANRNKNTYDTLYMIAYAKGVRGSQYNGVPASTKNEWKDKCYDHIIGYSYMEKYTQLIVKAEQIKLLKSMVFSLVKLVNIYQQIINTLPNKNTHLYQVRNQIVEPVINGQSVIPLNKWQGS